ncbi:MAG: ribulose 1,5-bisphosphate carboxylase [Verrucomicrobia bacterium]|jgi:ribulose-bisphosphate carboxylase large chain|nr:ribulose 1,5-bisphosphate carboxylase [Verrucomicrobiota bacterium]
MSRLTATYLIETPGDPHAAAEALAGEQSSGTFIKIPGETAELKERFAARVESLEPLEDDAGPSLPGAKGVDGPCRRARVRISWSLDNFGFNIPALLATLQGNLYELSQFSGLKLDDFDLPVEYAERFPGPAFGAEGSKRLVGVEPERPMIGTIIKPSVGLTPGATAALVRELAEADIDFIKDDELMVATANSPFEDRVDRVMEVVREHAERTGRKIMVAFNLSGELDEMHRRYDHILAAGGTCAMICVNAIGWPAAREICRRGELAIHAHRAGWGMLTRHPLLGVNFPAFQKIWRLAGVDQLHVNGLANKFWEPDDSVVRSIRSCLEPTLGWKPLLPVVSSGQWGGQAFDTYARTGSTDLLYLAGGGIMAHPAGPGGGVRAIRQAWEAAVRGLDLEAAAREYPEFRQSVETFGKPTA